MSIYDTFARIDRIDNRGDIREHLLRPGPPDDRTLCGLEVGNSQAACGNVRCANCIRIAEMKARKAAAEGGA